MPRPRVIGEKKTVTFSERHIQMMDEIMEIQGFISYAEVIKVALVDKYNKVKPPYSPIARQEASKPEAKLSAREKKKLRQAGEELCSQLGGESDGKVCSYYVYRHRDRNQGSVPLELLTDKHLKEQYFPNKNAITKLQERKEVNY